MTICLAAVAAAIALPATSAFAMDTPPASTPGGSTSSGSPPSSSGGPAAIPEPAAIGLFALGIAGAALVRRRQRRKPD